MRDSMTASTDVPAAPTATPASAAERYNRVRGTTLELIGGLAAEDTVVQSMSDASPTKWHLAHTTWFFEQFLLGRDRGYVPLNPDWRFLFNSYYQSIGPMHARPQRGLLSRPTLAEVLAYRARIDERMRALLSRPFEPAVADLLELGLNHEQQHQELLLTDLKHLFSLNPLQPAYRTPQPLPPCAALPLQFLAGAEGLARIGHTGAAFAFDCETPRHRVLLHPHAIANRPVNNDEFREFIRDDGYRTPGLWMAEGWDRCRREGWQRPLYWNEDLDSEFSLGGRVALQPLAPVCHIGFFEADAFARWAGARLPREEEWEVLAQTQPVEGRFLDSDQLRPLPPTAGAGARQLFGDVWEWTASAYVAYPGYRALPGALGEYNGKFMCGQYVLRGGSCVTPAGHMRASYRNFFQPAARWQFTGLRLGKDR